MTIVFMGWCTCSPHLAAHAAQEREVEWTPAAIRRPKKWTGCRGGEGVHDKNFFIFILFFIRFIKNICGYIFFQKCHPAAGSFGGKELPPDEPAVRSLAHGPWNLPPFHPAVAPYRQTNRR